MNILIVDLCHEKESLHALEYVRPVVDIVKQTDNDYMVMHFSDINKTVVEGFDKVILCGVALKDDEYLNHLDYFDWLPSFMGGVFGICAGAQVIGLLYGCKLNSGDEIELSTPIVVKTDPLFAEDDVKEIYCLHQNYVECTEAFDVLIQTEYPQLFKHTEKPVYGCLFHPEVRNKKLIENFINL